MFSRFLVGSLAALALLGLAGCGDDGGDVALVEGVTAQVTTTDNNYSPETLEVAAGTEVIWVNKGRNDHNVTPSDGGDFEIPIEDFKPGDEGSYRFTEPGEYPYYCTIHGTPTAGQIGTIVVVEAPTEETTPS